MASLARATPSLQDRKRTRARLRRWTGRALLLLPGLLVVACDLRLHHGGVLRASARADIAYAAAALLGVVLWGSLLLTATARRGGLRWCARALLVVMALLAVGGQLYAFGRYRAFLSTSSMLVGTALLPSIRQQLWFDQASFLRAVLPPVAAVVVLALVEQRLAPPRRTSRRLAPGLAAALIYVIAFFAPRAEGKEVAPFDTLYVHGLGQLARAHWNKNPCLARAHPGPRSPLAVPRLVPRPARPRNVLLVLTESVRASSACVAYDPDCRTTPFSNAAARARLPLLQMRSVDSTTAISLGVLWSGVSPTESREELHSAPLVWEYAAAAGFDTAYWTSQNLLFGNSGAWLQGIVWGHHVSATELEADPALETGADDGRLVSYVNDRLGTLREPFLAVVHLSNTHMPYAVDEDDTPFVPQSRDTDHEAEISNRYADAVFHQDRAVGRLLDAVRARPEGARTVVFYLSDHGEQLFEKGSFGHTGTLFEPEIHIPAWIDAPAGTLSDAEEAHLRALERTPLTTMDVLPTLVDLLGVLDDPGMTELSRAFVGRSLLRGGSAPETPVVLTNCSELWACAFRNAGAIAGTRKLIATEADHDWACYELADDPYELHDLGPAACGSLPALAEARLHGLPF